MTSRADIAMGKGLPHRRAVVSDATGGSHERGLRPPRGAMLGAATTCVFAGLFLWAILARGREPLASGWTVLSRIDEFDALERVSYEQTINHMVKLTYTASPGRSFDPFDASAEMIGWTLVNRTNHPPAHDPTLCGINAYAWYSAIGERLVLAYRGFDHDCDQCAFRRMQHMEGVPACAALQHPDYLAQAAEFANLAMAAHPRADVLFTGHSIGALLAFVTSSDRAAFTFVYALIDVPSDIPIPNPPTTVVVRNEFDPVSNPITAVWRADAKLTACVRTGPVKSNYLGAACIEDPQEFREFQQNMPSDASNVCMEAFVEIHLFDHYEDLTSCLSHHRR